MFLLAVVFAAAWFVAGSMAVLLLGLLERASATSVQAMAAAALVAPVQVAARLVEFFLLRRSHPLASARLVAPDRRQWPSAAATLPCLFRRAAQQYGDI
jgi:hypothetical protein